MAVALGVALGSMVGFELATGVAVAFALFVAPADACLSGGALWAAPAVPLLRWVANFAASGLAAAVDVRGAAGCGCVFAVSGAVAAASSRAAKGPPPWSWVLSWVAAAVCGHGEDATAGVALTFDA